MGAPVFQWMSESPLAAWVNSSAVIWPTLETVHFVSLCVLMGGLLVIDLRLLGFYRERCASTIAWLARLALLAFAVNLATGVLFLFGNTFKYVGNPAFELKLVLIAAAGINAAVYQWRLRHLVATEEVSWGSMAVGGISLALWAGVIVCGRMITYYAP
jgi:hypothetical protein